MGIFGLILLAISILVPAVWYVLKRIDNGWRKEIESRNVKYVRLPNMAWATWKKRRMEMEIDDKITKYGNNIGFVQLFKRIVLTADPELIQMVLSKEFTSFTNRRKINFNDKIFSKAISVVEDEQWKRLRSVITPTFSTGKLRQIKPCIDSTIQTMMKNMDKQLEKGAIMEIKQILSAFTMDTIVQTSFGIKVDSLVEKENPMIKIAQKLFSVDFGLKSLLQFAILFTMPKIAKIFNLGFNNEVTDYFTKIVVEIVKKKREEYKTNGSQTKASNFIELLLEAEREQQSEEMTNGNEHSNGTSNGTSNGYENGSLKKLDKYITNDEIVAQCVLFFLAGFETTASTITLACFLLALNPEKQDKFYEETKTVLENLKNQNDSGEMDPYKLITFESIPKFEYLTGVLNETLRLYGPVQVLERQAGLDITLETSDGRTRLDIKKDDLVQIPVYTLHKDPEHFPDPESFIPERFIDDSLKNFHKYAFLPFGAGPRNCVAKSFAMIEGKMALLHLILHYKFSISHKTTVPVQFFYQNNFIIPKNITLKVEKR